MYGTSGIDIEDAGYRYLKTKQPSDDFTKRLEKQVKNVKTSAKWRFEYMKLELKLYETREAGREEGREEGIALTKAVFRLDAEGYALSDIAVALSVSEDEVKRILEE